MASDKVAMEYLDMGCIMIQKFFSKVEKIEQSASDVLIRELTVHPSRRVVERHLQCSSCPDDSPQFEFKHLPPEVSARYKNAAEIGQRHGQFIQFEFV